MELSVIILNYNVRHFLEACLSSVKKAIAKIDAEIIVVDNASTDGSDQMMKTQFPDITYIYNKENTGFPKGNNIGVEFAKGTFLCILNPDTIVPEDIFLRLLDTYSRLQNPGILGCKLVDGKGHFLPESKRSTPTPWVAITKITGLHRLLVRNTKIKTYYAAHLREDQEGKVDVLAGAFMFLKTSLYRELGGFDEGCFMYADDIDLSYMSLQKGNYNFYIPSVQTIHFKGESTSKDEKYLYRFKEAMTFFYQKHLKIPFWFRPIMYIGITLFAQKKVKESGSNLGIITKFILISEDETLYSTLDTLLKKENQNILFENRNKIELSENERTEILVDAASVSYKEYIKLIINYRNNNQVTFKIKPEKANFFIGSNDKNGRGEILRLTC